MFNAVEYLQSDFFKSRRKLTFTNIICTINFVFVILGYELFMGSTSTFFSIEVFENSFITWYVRLIIIIFNAIAFLLGKSQNGKFDKLMMLFVALWIMYLIRAVHDLVFLTPLNYNINLAWSVGVDNFSKFRVWSYIIGFSLIPLMSLYRSWEQIDFQRALDFLIITGIFACVSSLSNIATMTGTALTGADVTTRADANSRMGSIVLGHFGVSIFIVSAFRFFYSNKFSVWKIICVVACLVGLLVTLRSGSRSPVAALLGVGIFWIGVIYRNLIVLMISSSFLFILLFMFKEKLVNIIFIFSPILAERLRLTIEYGQGREWTWGYIKEVFGHGFGAQLDLLGYSHNLFIDGFMMFGIMGWIIPAVFLPCMYRAYIILRERSYMGWVALLFLQAFIYVMFSACFGGNPFLQGTLFLIFLVFMKIKSFYPPYGVR